MNEIVDTLKAWNALPPGVTETRQTVGFEASAVERWESDDREPEFVHLGVTCLLHRDFFLVGGVKIPSPKGTMLEIVFHGQSRMMLGTVEYVTANRDGCATLRTREHPEYYVHTTVPAGDQSYVESLA